MTSIEMIAKEREEQQTKHGYTKEHDAQQVRDIEDAMCAILQDDFNLWPEKWDNDTFGHIMGKETIERYALIGAWAAALIDAKSIISD